MRFSNALPLAVGASGFVIPDAATAKHLVLQHEEAVQETLSAWWDNSVESSKARLGELRSSSEDIINNAVDLFDTQAKKLQDWFPQLEVEVESELRDFLPESLYHPAAADHENENTKGHVGKPGHHGTTNLTVYESIQASNFTKKFAAWVDKYPDIVKELNSTSSGNVTVFVPTDKAFEKIPKHGKDDHKPSKEVLKKILEYHVVPGYFPAGRVLAHHTLATAYSSPDLGDRPQRLRVSAGIFGVRVNFYSKVIMVNLFCANGVVHGVDSILVPPPDVEKVVELFPGKFSTLLLAAEKTGLVHEGEEEGKTTGLTLFAPSNWAFQKLGTAANAFLFNTEKGIKYLRALLLYHVVVNETLYSDVYYGRKKEDDEETEQQQQQTETDGDARASSTSHYDLRTALGDKSLGVDIARYYGFITMKVNGFTRVATQDGIGSNGVIHVIDSVLIPPHPHHKEADAYDGGKISVDDLVARLAPFVEHEEVGEL